MGMGGQVSIGGGDNPLMGVGPPYWTTLRIYGTAELASLYTYLLVEIAKHTKKLPNTPEVMNTMKMGKAQ